MQEKQVANDSAASSTSNDNCNGRVISHYGQQLDVESLNAGDENKIVRCFQRANLPELVTGDYVVWEYENEDAGIIVASAERKNVFARPGFGGKIKPVAANLDIVLIVIATLPEAFGNLVDRYLVAINTLGLETAIVLNKEDLISADNSDSLQSLLSIYENLEYPVYRVSAKTGQGIDALERLLNRKTTVLVGQSGVGKSSLINRLANSELILHDSNELAETGALSQGKYKGTHTTTTARLFHLANCDLIDSPGIREFELGHVSAADIEAGFPEIAAASVNCRFRDCKHQSEPGCAVAVALQNGTIHPERMTSYRQILQSVSG